MGCGASSTIEENKNKRDSVVELPPLDNTCKILTGHTNSVSQIVILMDGRLASSSWDGTGH